MDFGYEVTLLYSLYSEFLQRYGNYYVEEGTESGFIGTVSQLIVQYLSSLLEEMKQIQGGVDNV